MVEVVGDWENMSPTNYFFSISCHPLHTVNLCF